MNFVYGTYEELEEAGLYADPISAEDFGGEFEITEEQDFLVKQLEGCP